MANSDNRSVCTAYERNLSLVFMEEAEDQRDRIGA